MEASGALARALGHVRNAAAGFAAADDPSGESLFLAAECLELEGQLCELVDEPAPVYAGRDAVASLDAALAALAEVRPMVSSGLWSSLRALRARAAE